MTKADLIVTGSGGSSADGAHGGGYSWIHPRLMTHFLQWCCPEFAEEVLDVFQRYLSGDPSLVAESTSLHNATLQQQLQAAEDDKLRQQELLDQSVLKYEAAITTIALAKQEIAAKRDELVQELEDIKAQDREKYEAMVRYHNAKEEELQAHLRQLQQDNDDLEAGKRKLEDQMDSDSGRPLNVFKKARVEISAVNRDNTFYFWFPARHITIDAAIYFARKNYLYYAQLVTAAAVNDCFFADKAIAASLTQLTADSKHVVKAERHLLSNKFHELPSEVSSAIVLKLFGALEDQLHEVFGVRIYYEDFNMYMAINNIKLYQVLCKRLKKIYDVDFSTQIDAKFLAKMAHNFNKYTLGEFKIPLDSDYDEFDEETLADVQLRD